MLFPAHVSILPIYILHQTLIIIFGYYIVGLEVNLYLKFLIITVTAIPAAVLLYKIVQTNTFLRFLFGLKIKPKTEVLKSSLTNESVVYDN